MNELIHESSPYLLQHANNPVHWKAWNSESLASALSHQKLVLISIGYSACHWCHVMEQESFENAEVADLMNAHFTCIKVDREERPDVDAIYMKALQIMTGQGGWPLNIIALPDGRPVWGGTYFSPTNWMESLTQLHSIYCHQPQKMEEYANRLQHGLAKFTELDQAKKVVFEDSILTPLIEQWKKSFDHDFGGMARSPKFMMPSNYEFLMRYAQLNQDELLTQFVQLTLTKIAYGGVFDPLGGGFSRYSVDERWHIPHFEKMAYDNGQLLCLYAQAHKLQPTPLYEEVIRKTIGFIQQEWTSNEGGFYSAWDADSLNSKLESQEGAYYVWTKPQLEKLLGLDFTLFSEVYNINEFGYWEHENYVLIRTKSLAELAEANRISEAELQEKKYAWEQLLYENRLQRPKPGLDDKCLCSWNGMLLRGILSCYQALGEETYLQLALQNAYFIEQHFWQPEGNLCHTFKNGQASINGFLEDYAFVIAAFIELYETTFHEKWLHQSKQLVDYCLDYFFIEAQGLFSFTSRLDPELICSHFEVEDNVIPSSNSVMAKNLLRLACYFSNSHYRHIATQMIQKVVANIDYPSAYSNWLDAFLDVLPSQKEIAICGPHAYAYAKKLHKNYLPNVYMSATQFESDLPFLRNRYSATHTNYYLCQNKQCDLPYNEFDEFVKRLTRA